MKDKRASNFQKRAALFRGTHQCLLVGPGKAGFLIEKCKQPERLAKNHVEHMAIVLCDCMRGNTPADGQLGVVGMLISNAVFLAPTLCP